jgi:putative ABC transport system ATP-binding protein
MVTHNMRHALALGNRLIMMHMRRIILDGAGPEKAAHNQEGLLSCFYDAQGDAFASDPMLLA